jgi:hypothetical protein
MQHVGDRRKRLHRNAALGQRRLDLAERDPGLGRRDRPQIVGMGLQQRPAVAADLRWRRAAGPSHALHQLDGRRRAYLEAFRSPPDRAALRNRANDPIA